MNNHSTRISLTPGRLCMLIALVVMTQVAIVSAQTTQTYERRGETKTTTEVIHGEVLYVSGNELVVKMDDGQIKHFTVPAGATANVDGRHLKVNQLTPGTRLSQSISTTTTPKTIVTVRSVSGKVWHVNPPKTVILTLPDGTNKQFTVPSHAKFNIEGAEKTVFELRKGMNVTATAVTEVPETEVSRQASVSGQAPAATTPPEIPAAAQVGTLLVEEEKAQPDQSTAVATQAAATGEPAPKKLPKTGSYVPLIGLLGALTLLAAFGLRASRTLLSS